MRDMGPILAELEQLREDKKKLQVMLDAKIMFLNNGWEEERYALQESEMSLRQENERLKEMLVDTYGFGWPLEFARREKAGEFKDLRSKDE